MSGLMDRPTGGPAMEDTSIDDDSVSLSFDANDIWKPGGFFSLNGQSQTYRILNASRGKPFLCSR